MSHPSLRKARRLPIFVEPVADESFASYVDRLAAAFRVPVSVLLAATLGTRRGDLPLRGYGVTLPTTHLRSFAFSTGLDPERVRQMLLESYIGIAFRHSGDRRPLDRSRLLSGEWAYLTGSHVCPACLTERSAAWRLSWKLPWSFACEEHGCLLVDACPGCGSRTGPGRRDRRSAPEHLTSVAAPGRCANALPPGRARTGRAARPCGYALAAAPSLDLGACPDLLSSQAVLDSALRGERQIMAASRVSSVEFLAAARSLCALILYAAELDDLGPLPAPVAAAFADHLAGRSANDRMRRSLAGRNEDRRRGPRTRCYGRVPSAAPLVAAITPLTIRCLSSGSEAALADAVAPLARRAEARNRSYARRLSIDFAFPVELCAAYEAGLASSAGFSRRAGIDRRTARTGRHSFTAAQVPQLLWPELYERLFADLIPGTRPESVRRFCSMALVRAAHGCTWQEAALLLGLPQRSGRVVSAALVSRLSAAGHAELFAQRLREAASWLDAQPARVDYAERRRRLVGLCDVGEPAWRALCARCGASPGRGGRSRFAAAWLWSELTGGDYRLAPALRGRAPASARDGYRRFLASDLNRLQLELEVYGTGLLTRSRRDRAHAPSAEDVPRSTRRPEPGTSSVRSAERRTVARRVCRVAGPTPPAGGPRRPAQPR